MSWAWPKRRTDRVAMLVGRSFWAVLGGATPWRSGTSTSWRDAVAHAAQAIDVKGSRPRVSVWLSGALCPAFWLVPPQGLRDGAEWRAWVAATVKARHPLCREDDAPVVWVASESASPTLAAAMPWHCMQSLEIQLRDCGVESVKPAWSDALSRHPGQGSPSLRRQYVFDGETLVSVDMDRGLATGAVTFDGVDDLAQAQAICQRRGATLAEVEQTLASLNEVSLASDSGTIELSWWTAVA